MPPKKVTPASVPTSVEDMTMEAKINHMFTVMLKIENSLSQQAAKVTQLESEVTVLNKEVSQLKNIVNSHEQDRRSSTLRILGFPLTEEEKLAKNSGALARWIYDRIFLPIFSVAVSKKLLLEVPSISSISNCYRVGAAASAADTSSPPPTVVQLTSPSLRVITLKCKREANISLTSAEKEAGLRPLIIAEDLTQPSFKMLRLLQSREEVAKAWSIDGKLFFILNGKTQLNRVSSVFEDINRVISSAQK